MTPKMFFAIQSLKQSAAEGLSRGAEGLSRGEAFHRCGLTRGYAAVTAASLDLRFVRKPYTRKEPVDRRLSERSLAILAQFDQGLTLEQIGKEFGITRERVRQIAEKAGREPRHIETEEKRAEILARLRNRPMTLDEAVAIVPELAAGYVYVLAWRNGVRFLPSKARQERDAQLHAIAIQVKPGVSVRSLCNKDHALANAVINYMNRTGMERKRVKRLSDFSHRPAIVNSGIDRRLSIAQIAREVYAAENRDSTKSNDPNFWSWIKRYMPKAHETIRAYCKKNVRAPKAPHPASLQAKPVITGPVPENIIVLDTVKATAIANRGSASASQIASAIGTTRNSIIGHWNRERIKSETRGV
jgi:Sigma-70, region 4